MKGLTNSKNTLVFIAIAVMLMVVVHFVFKDTFKPTPPVQQGRVSAIPQQVSSMPIILSEDEWVEIEDAFDEPYLEYESPVIPDQQPVHEGAVEKETIADEDIEDVVEETPAPKAAKVKNEIEPFVLPDGSKPKIAIIIDDMGMNRTNGFRLIEMSAPLTLAFLPYAENLDDITKAAAAAGHELMIHMPMEAMDGNKSLGGIALRKGMDAENLEAQLAKAFESFEGYKGLNNHMGSRLTQDETAMDVVMNRLREKGLYFVDSKTIGSSVAAQSAWDAGILMAERDIFLDHEENIAFVRSALRKTENAAKRQGYAIAIGHPKDFTIQGLQEWLPTLEAKGFELVPASALVKRDVARSLLVQKEVPLEDVAAEIEPAADGEAEDEEESAVLPQISLPLLEPAPQPGSGLGLY